MSAYSFSRRVANSLQGDFSTQGLMLIRRPSGMPWLWRQVDTKVSWESTLASLLYSVVISLLNCEMERAFAIGVGSWKDTGVSMELDELNNTSTLTPEHQLTTKLKGHASSIPA